MNRLPFIVVDDFVADPVAAAATLRAADFADRKGPDGEVYKRVAPLPQELFKAEIEKALGFAIRPNYSIARLNYAGENPNNAVHADSGYDEFACIVYLTEDKFCSGGTAFWKHKILGFDSMPDETQVRAVGKNPGQVMKRLSADWNNISAWTQTALAEMKFNRAIFFKCKSFHSRFPFEAFGDSPENGRLIFVSFFNRA
jgi:hypothetical protein